jgi:hypothetical protein
MLLQTQDKMLELDLYQWKLTVLKEISVDV